ncbi:GDSL family lipase [Nocardiopsis sp. HNM0947]|uniref:GDSL family lipase n=1 Tax=Nocardiopsis coralli TaxID=2772213 RepID=A0ABR9PDZ4_9ACTN|nr:GDSL-type esterase/lipase family protein [Nocardiopsis coralli]MBE3002034.1 GDSL family lipase [Nocardiopsis coralli]
MQFPRFPTGRHPTTPTSSPRRRPGPLLVCGTLAVVLLIVAAVGYWASTSADPGDPQTEAEERPVSDPQRIMLAGDSMTQGADGDRTWRYHLWNHLSPHVEGLDFVGPYSEPASSDMILPVPTTEGEDPSGPEPGSAEDDPSPTDGASPDESASPDEDGGAGGARWPGTAAPGEAAYDDPDFDHDHNALWGRTLRDASASIGEEVRTHEPDVLLAMIGINDLLWPVSMEEMELRLRGYVEAARAGNPNLRVVLAEAVPIALADSDDGFALRVYAYNEIVREVAEDMSTKASPVISLDVANAEKWDVETDTYDGTHPNADGELKIAAAFADALSRGYGIGPGYPRPLPITP